MKRFSLILKAVAGSLTGNNVIRRKKSSRYSSFSSLILSQAGVGLLLAVCFGFSSFLSYNAIKDVLTPTLNQQYISLSLSSALLSVMAFSCTYVASYFFYSKSDETFLPLPIKPEELFLARYILTMIFSLSFSILVFAECLIFGLAYNPSFLKVLGSLVIFITVPVIAVSVGFTLINTIGKLFNIRSHRWVLFLMTIIFSLVAMVSLILLSLLGSEGLDAGTSDIAAIYQSRYASSTWINWIGYIPSRILASEDSQGYLYIFYQILVGIGALGLSLLSAKLFYIKNLGYVNTKKKSVISIENLRIKSLKSFNDYNKSPFKACFKREFTLRKTNATSMMYSFFIPIFLGLMGLVFLFSMRYTASSIFEEDKYCFLFVTGICIFSGMVPMGSYSSLSLEGKNISSILALPLDKNVFLKSKIIYNNFLPISICLILSLAGTFGCQFDPLILPLSLIAGIPFILFQNEIGMMFGIKYARFNWDNVAEIGQKGLGPFLVSFVSYITMMLGMGIVVGLTFAISSNFWFIVPIVSCVIFSLLYLMFHHFSLKEYSKLLKSDILF